jgi:hypothetical protein
MRKSRGQRPEVRGQRSETGDRFERLCCYFHYDYDYEDEDEREGA